jgi:alkaline phosphatase
VISLLTDDHLSFELVRDVKKEPSLSEMTSFSLQYLDNISKKDVNSKGFFVMIEGSRIDHCLHENDAACASAEAHAFDRAFEIAYNFTQENKDTILISVADHDTGKNKFYIGALTLGRLIGKPDPEDIEMAWYPDVINKVTNTQENMLNEIKAGGDIRETLLKYTIVNVTDEEYSYIKKKIDDNDYPKNALSIGLQRAALINFATRK